MTLYPRHWRESAEAVHLWLRLRMVRRSVLMLDYDGTLAPFKNNRLEAYPYPGVEDRLAVLAVLPNVRLVLVSGRPARELAELLGSRSGSMVKFEIWGNHGWERLAANGSYQFFPPDGRGKETIERVKRKIAQLGFSQAIEAKPASIAVHWRGLEPAAQDRIRSAVESIYTRSAVESDLHLLAFDGGLELCSKNRTKGTVVEEVLAEEEAGLPAAYLGDDLTDEDAFTALDGRGLSILVRPHPRESFAPLWIEAPGDLLQFLDEWIRASEAQAASAGVSPVLPGGSTAGQAEEDDR